MEKLRLTIKGVMFALFPDYDKTEPNSEELVEQVTERLGELDKKRPPVILVPEPDNVYDRKAIRAWCEGKPIGRVAADETAMAHKLFDDEHEMVMTRIVEVEVKRKGNFFVEAELPEGDCKIRKNFLTTSTSGNNGYSICPHSRNLNRGRLAGWRSLE